MKIEYKELKPSMWKDVERLFGPNGGCAGCWCIWWRLPKGGKLWQETRGAKAKRMFQGLVKKGKARGILAYADGQPVGWATFGPRTDFPRLETAKAYQVEDVAETWSIPCFYIPAGFRNKGIARGLLAAVIKAAKKHRAKILEGYPVPLTKEGKKLPASFSWTGPLKMFEDAGFKIVQQQSYSRPLVRKKLKGRGFLALTNKRRENVKKDLNLAFVRNSGLNFFFHPPFRPGRTDDATSGADSPAGFS